jgi:putative transposase
MTTVLQGYQFALDPTPRKQASLASHTGAALFAYNWGLVPDLPAGRPVPG